MDELPLIGMVKNCSNLLSAKNDSLFENMGKRERYIVLQQLACGMQDSGSQLFRYVSDRCPKGGI